MSVSPAPLGEAFPGISEGLAGCPPLYVRFAFAVFPPPKLEAQKVEGGFPRCDVRAKRNDLRFLCGQLQPKLTKAFPKYIEETFGVFFLLEDADEVVCKSNQPRFPFAVRDDHFLPVLMLFQGNHKSSAKCRYTFARIGEIIPPCGVPVSGRNVLPSVSNTPAVNHFSMSHSNALSRPGDPLRQHFEQPVVVELSKKPLMSASTT